MKRLVAIGIVLAATLSLLASGAVAQDDPSGPGTIVVHSVDARSNPVELLVLSDDYSSRDVVVQENGQDKQAQVALSNRPAEIVFVVDSSQRLRLDDVFGAAKSAIAAQIRSLPAGTRVGVVEAGKSAVVVSQLTEDLESAAVAVEALDFSNGGKIYNAMDRAVSLFSRPAIAGEPERNQTLVVFAGGADAGSDVEIGPARAGLIRLGAQAVAVQYAGGDTGLPSVVQGAGGLVLRGSSADEVSAALDKATDVAAQRLLVTFDGTTDVALRGDVSLQMGSAQTSLSYGGGQLTSRTIALAPSLDVQDRSLFGFFQTQTGLYLTLLLSFLGIGLAIFVLGSIFAGGESSLEGLLARYSGSEDDLDVEESNIVQTALVQRAVQMSENFAEDRGFLLKVEEMLERARLPLRPGEAMSFYVGGIFVGMIVGYFMLGGLVGSVIFALGIAIGAIMVLRFIASRRMRQFEKQLPDTLQLLAGTLRAGYSLPQGLEAVSTESVDPMGYELRRVMTEARLGRELEEALGAAAERLNSPDFAWAVMAISIQREVGGNLNELLMTVSDTMVARERLKGEVATLTAEGKMSAILLGGLPPGLGLVMWVMNPEYIDVLFTNFLGKVFLGAGIVSSIIGLAWMKKVITIDV